MKTHVPVRAVADLMDPLSGDKYEALLPLTLTIEGGMLTLGTHYGPDLWRAELKDLMAWIREKTLSDDLVKRLRNTPNWKREEYGGYKSTATQYDRAPFEAADHIEELEANLSKSEALLAKAVEVLDWAVDMTGEPHCYHDHHGYCQAHNLQPKGECWVELARPLIAELKGQDNE